MDNITDVRLGPLKTSKYMSPFRIFYKQNGIKKAWDVLDSHDSVVILLHHKLRDTFIFVKQFRPAVYIRKAGKTFIGTEGAEVEETVDTEKYPGHTGVTHELCAGIVDKDKPLIEIAQEEILEECGYKVDLDKIEKISSFRASVGLSGGQQTMFYAEVTDDMKVSEGGGNPAEGEFIEVVEIPVKDSLQFCMDESISKPVGMISAIYWYHLYKGKKENS